MLTVRYARNSEEISTFIYKGRKAMYDVICANASRWKTLVVSFWVCEVAKE